MNQHLSYCGGVKSPYSEPTCSVVILHYEGNLMQTASSLGGPQWTEDPDEIS